MLAGARALVVPGHAFLVGVADRGVTAGGVALAAVTVEAWITILVCGTFFAGRSFNFYSACA